MRKTICACFFLAVIIAYTSVSAQKEEKITVSTYYPSPSGIYQTIRLSPSTTPPVNAKSGQLYYNSTWDKIMYLNSTNNWTNISGGTGDNITQVVRGDNPPAGAVPGDIFFNNRTNTIMYYNNADKWVNMSGPGYWFQGANNTASLPFWYYPVYLANRTARWVGIGTKTPDAALAVQMYERSGVNENETAASFTKILNAGSTGSPKSQTLSIALYPNETRKPSYPSYLDSTSLIVTPQDPGGSLQLQTDDTRHNMTFNVGGYSTPATEVMSMRNIGYAETEGSQDIKVGIGNSTAPFAFFVDSKLSNTSAFGFRGRRTGVKHAIGTITPYNNSVWFTYGPYLENNRWKHTEYQYPLGTPSRVGAAFVLSPQYGGKWYAYGAANLIDNNKTVGSWLYQNVTLWDVTGNKPACSSRRLKENFTPLSPDELLNGIDQLDVSRWNFKTDERSNTHIGPVAENFNQVFDVGRGSRKSIYHIDEIGVSLAGIKALSGRIKKQQQMIKELQSELKYLESQLSRGQ
jgi:hypothetical protein